MKLILTVCKNLWLKIGLQILFTFLISVAFAQEKITVSGKVTNGESALINVSVKVAGSKQGTTTNEQGNFQITVSKGQTLVFSYVGFEDHSVIVSDQSELTIILNPSTNNTLNDVVVVGYGTKEES